MTVVCRPCVAFFFVEVGGMKQSLHAYNGAGVKTMKQFAVVLMAAGVLPFLWVAVGLLLRPLMGKVPLEFVLQIRGEDTFLEARVYGLMWFRSIFGTVPEIVLLDCGMEERTREIAFRLANSRRAVSYRKGEDQLNG